MMWLYCKDEDSFRIASAFQLLSRVQELEEEMRQREWSPFYFPLLLFRSPFGRGIMQVKYAPTWWKGLARKEASLCINRTGTTALPNKRGLLKGICVDLLHWFCIQLLIMALSTSQSWLMVVGMQRTVDSADLILGRVGKKQNVKLHPPAVYNRDSYSGVPFGRFGGNRGCPGAWSLGNETAGQSITAMMEGRSFMAHLSMGKIALSHLSHATLNGNSDFTHTYLVPFSIRAHFSFSLWNDCVKCVLQFPFYKWGNWDSQTTRSSLYSHPFIKWWLLYYVLNTVLSMENTTANKRSYFPEF